VDARRRRSIVGRGHLRPGRGDCSRTGTRGVGRSQPHGEARAA
jgi:hypothetical protein